MNRLWEMIQGTIPTFGEDMSAVEKRLIESIPASAPDVLYNASMHLIKNGGKRIRPALVILSFNAVNINKDRKIDYAIPIAVAVELIHTATIIHDDIIDRSSMRRGVRTVNEKWGDDIALLAGDLIFSMAFGIIGSHEKREINEIMSGACMRLARGEVLEELHTGDTQMTEEVYLEIIERKTASLFEASARCGAILGEGEKKEIEAISRYGYSIGIGFQMTDDILDVIAGEIKLGKPVGKDIALGKPTFITLHAIKNASQKDKETIRQIIQKKTNTRADVKKALKIIERTGSIEYANKRAKFFILKAKNELKNLRESNAKRGLEMIAEYAIKREF